MDDCDSKGHGRRQTGDRDEHDPLSRTPDAPATGPLGRTLGHYRLEARLGAGGMGEVYRARDVALGRPAAVKVLPNTFGEGLRSRLRLEAEAGSRLQHPAIATFYEAGEQGHETFIAMECVEGRTLRERLSEGAMPLEEALAIVSCVLAALGHAHAAGILHRDIKPENIMLTGPRTAKLLDFGLALPFYATDAGVAESGVGPTGSVVTLAGSVVGTIGYMAPEQIRCEPLDARVDVFQAGAVLYEMLTGLPAFPGRSASERLAAILTRDPDFGPLGAALMPPGLTAVLKRALTREVHRRHASAAEFLRDVLDLTEGRSQADLPDVLAVLDFENLSGSAEVDWLGAGIAESLTADLSRAAGLTVVPRLRVQKARALATTPGDLVGVGVGLGCGSVLTGSFQRMGPAVRITTHLLEVPTGNVLFTEKLDGTLDGVFDLQDRLARAVIASLSLKAHAPVADRVRPETEAYECYTRAQAFARLGRDSLGQAHALLARAIELSTDWAPPLALDAWIVGLLTIASSSNAGLEQSLALAERAIEIDPRLARAWLAKGYVFLRRGDFEAASHAYLRVIEIDPQDHEGHYFLASTRSFGKQHEDAIPAYRRSLELEPRLGMGWLGLGGAFLCLGRHLEARHAFERALALEGDSAAVFPTAGAASYLAELTRLEGHTEEARTLALSGIAASEASDHPYRDFFRGYGLGVLGRTALDQADDEAARAAFGQLVAMLKGRPKVRAGGHLVVQALAGLARVNASPEALDDGLRLFATRDLYSFEPFFGCMDDKDLFELALAARALHRTTEADDLLARSRAAGSREHLPGAGPGPGQST